MVEPFVDFINTRVQISLEIASEIQTLLQIEEFPKGHLLIKEGMIAHRLYFIVNGSARTYYFHDGKDVTSWIYKEDQLITSWSSFFGRQASFESVQILEDSKVCSLTYDHLQDLYFRYPKIQEFGRLIVEEQLVFLDQFYKGFLFSTAKEKYDLLLSVFPDVTSRVNLGHIASLLGITQETLSRIRRN